MHDIPFAERSAQPSLQAAGLGRRGLSRKQLRADKETNKSLQVKERKG